MVKVSINIVTFNSAQDIVACVQSVEQQTFRDFRIRVWDNDSKDETLPSISTFDVDLVRSGLNVGFARGHNELVRRFPSEFVLFLNPDTILGATFLAELISALVSEPRAASAAGKLLRMDGRTLDSTGIVMIRSQRHLDRGAEEPDTHQYDVPSEIFGPSGAAAFYRRAALDDVAINGQYFDEDFFAYREDADLAWRCRLRGWTSIYVPTAVARHRRRVTPERRSDLPAVINRHSVKNRFLLRINNMTGNLYRRDFVPITVRDLSVVGYVLFREWTSIPALTWIVWNFRRLWKKRNLIQARRTIDARELEHWFT
jgi:GT2 family glycosyltransferase